MTYEKFRAKYRIVKVQYDERPNYFTYIVQRRKFFFWWGAPVTPYSDKRFLSFRVCMGEYQYITFWNIEDAEDAIEKQYKYWYRVTPEVVA